MFNFFKSAPEIEYEDRVWIDNRRRLAGICEQILDATGRGKAVMVVAFFDDMLATLDAELSSRGITFQRMLSLGGTAASGTTLAPVWLLPASGLPVSGGASNVGATDPDLYVIVAEHHPMPERDRVLLEAIAALPFSSRILYYTSLDEPLMMRFGGERIGALMQTLGHDDETCLEHDMIARSIRNAQKKIEKKVGTPVDARSAEEWFRLNMPG